MSGRSWNNLTLHPMDKESVIKQTDPRAAYLAHKEEIDVAIARVLASDRYILGAEVEAFDAEFAEFLGARYSISVASGTDALELALRACGVRPGDVVLTVSHTAVATVAAIERCGGIAVFVDVDPQTFTLVPEALEAALATDLPGLAKAIVPVHLYGHPAEMPAICDIARRYDLFVIEDCAQAHGAAIGDQKMGTWGDIAAFSFYPTKNLGAVGDGGSIVTNNEHLAEKAEQLRQYGWKSRYVSDSIGYNSRLDEIQAAILRVKLKYLTSATQRRQKIAAAYKALLSDVEFCLPFERNDAIHVYHQFVIQHQDRDLLRSYLAQHNIATLIHYPLPVHLQPAFSHLAKDLPKTERLAKTILSLPMHPGLSESNIEHITSTMINWLDEEKTILP